MDNIYYNKVKVNWASDSKENKCKENAMGTC